MFFDVLIASFPQWYESSLFWTSQKNKADLRRHVEDHDNVHKGSDAAEKDYDNNDQISLYDGLVSGILSLRDPDINYTHKVVQILSTLHLIPKFD